MIRYTGSCGCGQVQYKINSKIDRIINCNCSVCRSANGGAFSTYAVVAFKKIKLLSGQEHLSSFMPVANSRKHFCSQCGTPIYKTNENYPNSGMVYFGTLTDCLELVPNENVHCHKKIAWEADLGLLHKLSGKQQNQNDDFLPAI